MHHCILKHSIALFIGLVSVLPLAANQPDSPSASESHLKLLIAKANKLVNVSTNYDTVNSILNQADQLIKLPENTHEAIDIMLLRGINDANANNLEKAIDFYYNALDQAEQSGDSAMIAKSDHYLGRIFDEMEEYDDAISFFKKSLKISESDRDTTLLAKTFQNIAISYQNKGKLDIAIQYNKKAEDLARIRKDTTMLIDVTNNFGTIAYDQKDLDKAQNFYEKALELYRKKNDQQGIATAYNNIGLVYLDKKEYPKSLRYFSKAFKLGNKLKMYDFIGDIYSNLTIYYATIKDYKNAYHFYDLYNTVYDSLAGEKKLKMLRMIQAKYQLHKTHRDMEVLQKKNRIQLRSIDNAKLVQAYLATITVVVVLLMITTIYLLVKEKKMARSLKAKTDELSELNITKDKFFSIVAHDLRNPFNILVSYTNLLKKNLDSFTQDELKQIVNDLNNASENGYNLLQNLLLWSRSQTNRIHVFRSRLNLLNLFNQVKGVVEFNLSDKNQKLVTDIDSELVIYADKDMISTILRNLLFNAMKFSSRGSEIKVNAYTENEFARVDVIDSGIGIAPEIQKKLFKLDYNTSMKGTDGEPGTGLGLVICHEFVEKNGGKIWIESTPGKGSVFSFSIPLSDN